jgi:hypothetical protein
MISWISRPHKRQPYPTKQQRDGVVYEVRVFFSLWNIFHTNLPSIFLFKVFDTSLIEYEKICTVAPSI